MNVVKKTHLKQNLGAFAILVVSFIVVWRMVPEVHYEPRGMAYASQVMLAPVSASQVAIFERPPFGARVVGRVSAQLSLLADIADKQSAVIEHARGLAAGIGATGIVIRMLGTQGNVIIVEAIAINV